MNGILGAFSAYQNNVYEGEKKLKLPGLENYSNDQIFFMGFGMIWCSLYTNDGLVQQLNDIHPPGYIRAIMTLRHFDEFAKSWNCNKSTYMNPDKKCKLWVD
ncbi:hypothetical protein AAG570_011084 [Ranatra chinensis]|uniref:Peptidase M13 C-terminal domain-containing protein n=1 Tax=Ranatra chinensis TaxID=642074 RepID=A0ABD0YXY9_9HEMI